MELSVLSESHMQKTIWTVVVIALLALGGVWVARQPKGVSGETIRIGGAFGLSGVCAEWGEGDLKAVQLAVEELNTAGEIGKPIELIVEDTQCDGKATVSAVQKLIFVDKIEALIGPTWGDSFQGAFPLIRENKIVAMLPSASIEAIEFNKQPLNFLFSTWFPQRAEVETLQKYAVAHGFKTFVVTNDADPFDAMMAALFRAEAKDNGITILDEHQVVIGTQDFRTILARIKAKSPDAFFVAVQDTSSKATFLKQAREIGITSQLFSSADIQNPSLLQGFSSALEGVIYTYPSAGKNSEMFFAKYRARYGSEPQGSSASNAYDAVNILAAAMKKAGTEGEKLERALLETSIPGVTYDTLKFSEKHQIAGGEFEIKTIKNGAFVKVP